MDKKSNVKIKGIEIYYPEYTRDVDEIIEKYDKLGQDIEIDLKEFLGRKTLHLIKDNEENTLTMAIEVAKKVLQSTNLNGTDIDMIVLSSNFPEYVSPPTSVFIHQAIGAKETAHCYDINVNCCGMVVAMKQIYDQMQVNDEMNRVLLVGCDSIAMHLPKDVGLLEGNFGDVACAIVLEKTEEDSCIVDTRYYVNHATSITEVAMPNCGNSHIYEVVEKERRLRFGNVNGEIDKVALYIKKVLDENNMKAEDISMFCCTQFSLYYVKYLRKSLNISKEKVPYVAGDFGYTGTTSPFLALYWAVKEKKINRGEYIFFWGLGVGTQHVFILMKY